MRIKDINEFNEKYLDVLREVGNIGAGNAATALSEMLGYMVKVSVPSVKVADMKDVAKEIDTGDEEVIAILINLDQDLIGTILTVLYKPFVNELIKTFLGCEIKTTEDLRANEMAKSALSEVGNITAANYVNALARLSKMTINILTPDLHIEKLQDMMEKQTKAFKEFGDKVVLIDESFIIKDEEYKSSMILMLELDSLNDLMEKLGVE